MIFIAIILFIVFIAEQGKKRNRLVLTLAILFLFGVTVKSLVHEMRPCLQIPSKIQCPGDYSFPSNHALVAFALATALWKKENGWIYALFALFVAFTRIYLGVHTSFDVLGAIFLGITGYAVITLLWERMPTALKGSFLTFLG